MSPDAPLGAEPERISAADSARSWLAALLHYLELKLQLLGFESKDAGIHLLVLALLFASTVIFFAGSLIAFAVFLLYLTMRILHWEWGWSALLCAGILLVLSIVTGVILRFKVVKPVFPLTLAEIQKDREWLARKKYDE